MQCTARQLDGVSRPSRRMDPPEARQTHRRPSTGRRCSDGWPRRRGSPPGSRASPSRGSAPASPRCPPPGRTSRHAATNRSTSAESRSDAPPRSRWYRPRTVGRAPDFRLEGIDVPGSSGRSSTPTVEIAVVADRRTERDVEVRGRAWRQTPVLLVWAPRHRPGVVRPTCRPCRRTTSDSAAPAPRRAEWRGALCR